MSKKQRFNHNRSIFGVVSVHVRTKRTKLCKARREAMRPGPCVTIKPEAQ
jgi:hypothetical protein